MVPIVFVILNTPFYCIRLQDVFSQYIFKSSVDDYSDLMKVIRIVFCHQIYRFIAFQQAETHQTHLNSQILSDDIQYGTLPVLFQLCLRCYCLRVFQVTTKASSSSIIKSSEDLGENKRTSDNNSKLRQFSANFRKTVVIAWRRIVCPGYEKRHPSKVRDGLGIYSFSYSLSYPFLYSLPLYFLPSFLISWLMPHFVPSLLPSFLPPNFVLFLHILLQPFPFSSLLISTPFFIQCH